MSLSTSLCGVGRGFAMLAALALAHAANAQSSSAPSYLDLGVGAFDVPIHRGAVTTAEGLIEFRYGGKLFYIGPALGVLVNGKGGVYGYGGFYGDFAFDRFVVTPLAAVGAYRRGDGPNLGGPLEFRLSITAAYELDDKSRLGLQIAHISNAGIYHRNPDDNEVLVTYGIPLQLPF